MDWLRYIAGYGDLITALGTDAAAGEQHYNLFGKAEGRRVDAFDPFTYGASNPDLTRALGANAYLLEKHYIEFGFREARAVSTFDALRYGASNPDLIRVFGADPSALSKHFLEFGLKEGRPTASFDALRYAASNPDLAKAFGSNQALLTQHFVQFGSNEGRPTTSFDALNYAAVNADLAAAFSTDTIRLTRHYIELGIAEGRATIGFDAVAYLLNNSDLAGRGVNGALRHWIEFGRGEGRSANSFGNDQVNHDAAIGRITSENFANTNDRDWFAIYATQGQNLSLGVLRPDLAGASLSGARIDLFRADGTLVLSKTMAADGFDNWLAVTAAGTGMYFVSVSSGGTTGDYKFAVAPVGPDYNPGDTFGHAGFIGGAISDVFLGGNGHSIIQPGDGDDIVGGGAGQDDFIDGAGADFMDGGNAIGADNTLVDSVSYQNSPAGVTAYLDGRTGVGGFAQGDRLLGIEALYGSSFADKLYAARSDSLLYGAAGGDQLFGGSGDDHYLSGGDGDDLIYGDAGSDLLAGGAGADQLDGGAGFDVADYQIESVGARVDLRSGVTGGSAAGDTLVSIEGLIGSYGGDDILATAGASGYQQLLGYGGNDILIDRSIDGQGAFLGGGPGNDLLVGSDLRGEDGNDTLVSFREGMINRSDGLAGADNYIIETSRHSGSAPFDFSLNILSFDQSDHIDVSQLRDEGGRTLDYADITAHLRGNLIDLTGFKTASGTSVVGYVELNQKADLFDPTTPLDIKGLSATNFIFTNGIAWQTQVPGDFPIF